MDAAKATTNSCLCIALPNVEQARERAGTARLARRVDVSGQRASGGRSRPSGWMPENEARRTAISPAAGPSGSTMRTKDEMAVVVQHAAHGGQCALPAA